MKRFFLFVQKQCKKLGKKRQTWRAEKKPIREQRERCGKKKRNDG